MESKPAICTILTPFSRAWSWYCRMILRTQAVSPVHNLQEQISHRSAIILGPVSSWACWQASKLWWPSMVLKSRGKLLRIESCWNGPNTISYNQSVEATACWSLRLQGGCQDNSWYAGQSDACCQCWNTMLECILDPPSSPEYGLLPDKPLNALLKTNLSHRSSECQSLGMPPQVLCHALRMVPL